MLLGKVLLGVVHIAISCGKLRMAEDAFDFKLICAVHDGAYGHAMAQEVGMEPWDAGLFAEPLQPLCRRVGCNAGPLNRDKKGGCVVLHNISP